MNTLCAHISGLFVLYLEMKVVSVPFTAAELRWLTVSSDDNTFTF